MPPHAAKVPVRRLARPGDGERRVRVPVRGDLRTSGRPLVLDKPRRLVKRVRTQVQQVHTRVVDQAGLPAWKQRKRDAGDA